MDMEQTLDSSFATALFSNNRAPIAYLDTEYNFLKVNNAYAELFEKTVDFFPGKNHFDIYQKLEYKKYFQEVIDTAKPHHAVAKAFEYACLLDDSKTYWDWLLSPVLLDDGEVGGLLLVLTNVTEYLHATMDIGKEKDFCQKIIDGAAEVIMLLDSSGHIVLVNRKLATILGVDKGELKDKVFWQLVGKPEDDGMFSGALASVLETGKEKLLNAAIVSNDNQEKQYLWTLAPFGNNDNVEKFIICTGTDFSHYQGYEDKLLLDNQEIESLIEESRQKVLAESSELKRSSELKSRLIHKIGHEFRTPLNAIIGFTQLMKMDYPALTGQQQSHINEIIHAAESLNDMTRSLTNYSLILDDKLKFIFTEIPERDIFEICSGLASKLKKLKNVEVRCILESSGIKSVSSDKKYLRDILENMINKAANLSSEGGVLTIGMEPLENRNIRIYIDSDTIIDTGLAEAEFATLSPLEADNSDIDWYDLVYIVTRKIINSLDGEEGFINQGEKGFRLYLDLPVPNVGNQQAETVSHDRATSRILYVEDNDANRRLVSAILKKEPHIELQLANNGTEGIEFARKEFFDIIILDINLPDMSGVELLQKLRNDPSVKCNYYFALTANSMKEEIEKGIEAGFDKYITKPFEIRKFLDAVDSVL